jgi:hypothetical protein
VDLTRREPLLTPVSADDPLVLVLASRAAAGGCAFPAAQFKDAHSGGFAARALHPPPGAPLGRDLSDAGQWLLEQQPRRAQHAAGGR